MGYNEYEKAPSPHESFITIDNRTFVLNNIIYKMGEKM